MADSRHMRIQSVRFSEPQWAGIQQEARRSGVSASQYIREAVIARVAWDLAAREPELVEDWNKLIKAVAAKMVHGDESAGED